MKCCLACHCSILPPAVILTLVEHISAYTRAYLKKNLNSYVSFIKLLANVADEFYMRGDDQIIGQHFGNLQKKLIAVLHLQ